MSQVGRPRKRPEEKGIIKRVNLYQDQINMVNQYVNNSSIKTNSSEVIRAAIMLLEHFDQSFLDSYITDFIK